VQKVRDVITVWIDSFGCAVNRVRLRDYCEIVGRFGRTTQLWLVPDEQDPRDA